MLTKIANYLPTYTLLLFQSFIVAMLIWTIFVDGKLYYCSDKIFFLDFFPPFVHGEKYNDRYISDPAVVWAIWFILVGLALISPYFLARKLRPFKNSKTV